jgi:hypothetical protein
VLLLGAIERFRVGVDDAEQRIGCDAERGSSPASSPAIRSSRISLQIA